MTKMEKTQKEIIEILLNKLYEEKGLLEITDIIKTERDMGFLYKINFKDKDEYLYLTKKMG